MASDAKAKDKDKKDKKAKPAGGEAKEKKPKKDKGEGEKAAAAVATAPPPKPAEPRPPADPRLKVLKKFQGRFLPKGVLRERYKAIQQRWDSGDDHGGVTVEELKALLADWRATREKPPRLPKA